MKISLIISFLLIFLTCSQQQNLDFFDCDVDHPFRLITRMSGKSLFALISPPQVVLDFIDSATQSNSDVWLQCNKVDDLAYIKNVKYGLYLSINSFDNSIEATIENKTLFDLDTWNLVPGYTLIISTCRLADQVTPCDIAYEQDILNAKLGIIDPNDLFTHWNLQPLDRLPKTFAQNDCSTPFAIRNKASGLYISFGNIYPYDGFITPHYGVINTLEFNTCPDHIPDLESKLWVLCNGILRSKYQLPIASPFGYYYIINDSIRISTAFMEVMSDSEVLFRNPAFLDQWFATGNIYIILNTINPNNGQAESVFLYENQICGGQWSAYGAIEPEDNYKWIIEDPNNVVIPI